MKYAKMFVMAAALTLGSFGAASAGQIKYEAGTPRAVIQQHENYVRSLERAAARQEKASHQVSAKNSPDAGTAVGMGVVIATVLLLAL
jgi:hypothetical protein